MKKTYLIGLAISAMFVTACGKSENGNKGVVEQQNSSAEAKNEGETLRYVAEDGSSALVTFKNSDDDKSISIRSNNKTISAPQKSEGLYGNYDFEIAVKNDSVTITQGDNVIRLKKARGQ